MTTRLVTPFSSLTVERFLSRGAGGHVFAISRTVVIKVPTCFENAAPVQAEEMVESLEKIEHEKEIYRILQKHRHPNIVDCILAIPEGFFMPRLETTLEIRLSEKPAPDESIQLRWIQQLTSSVAWLEGLGLAHGDLRPANVLVDKGDDLHLADFDVAVKLGEQIQASTGVFCKHFGDFELPIASPQSEQFALGSCFYNIRFGYIPFHDLDDRARVQKMMRDEFPPTDSDTLLGDLIQACWHGKYESINAIHEKVLPQLLGSDSLHGQTCGDISSLLLECEQFLAQAKRTNRDSNNGGGGYNNSNSSVAAAATSITTAAAA